MTLDPKTWIYETGLSNRAINALERNNIYNVQQLAALSDGDLSGLRGVGVSIVNEIKVLLDNNEEVRLESGEIVDETPDYGIRSLGLSNRTENALINNGVYTLRQLRSISPREISRMRGVGRTSMDEINKLLKTCSGMFLDDSQKYTISEYLQKVEKSERNIKIVVDYYNSRPNLAYQAFAEKYNLTRERVRQLILRSAKKIGEAFDNGYIKDDISRAIEKAALERTEVHNLAVQDEKFTASGISFLVADFEPKRYEIYKGSIINGCWLVCVDDNIGKVIHDIYSELRYSIEPLRIADIREQYSLSDEIILSINGAVEAEGFITHEKNKKATGNDNCLTIERYLDSIDRPASIMEMSEKTGLTKEMIRSALNHTRIFRNVGKSVYDLVSRDYEELSIGELARKILIAEDRPLKVKVVTEYVKRYKGVISEEAIVGCLLNDIGLRYEKERLFLYEWPSEKLVKQSREKYFVRLEDAVLAIIEESEDLFDFEKTEEALKRFEGAVSMNPSSIKSTLSRLADKHLIVRVANGVYRRKENLKDYESPTTFAEQVRMAKFIDERRGGTINMRYKSKRVNSDKRWRTIPVREQDSRYIYTGEYSPNGYEIKYVKDRIVEYK